ncbi:hypothetical protein K7432_007039 [Basidiobolus ranarum]|uniref:Fungal lipase-type domain-containing protein n=1 Tax=Basidiobolus ranarum TaxID=34480 RepID=A0ABR2W1L4_9FUNG
MRILPFLILCSASLALASPVAIVKRGDIEVERVTKDMLIHHSNYAAAAYCSGERVRKWDCGSRCPGNVKVATYFENSATGMAGYVGVNHDEKTIIVAFRGSSNIKNWFKNLQILPTNFEYPDSAKGTKVHYGFWDTYNSVSKDVISGLTQVISQLPEDPKDYKLLVTGHSLGGAVAVVGAMEIKRHLLNPKSPRCITPPAKSINLANIYLHTYGQPRVGNENFARLAYKTLSNSTVTKNMIRVTNRWDPVPRVPSGSYRHSPHEVYIKGLTRKTVHCDDGSSAEDPRCTISEFPSINFVAHLRYWNVVFGPFC